MLVEDSTKVFGQYCRSVFFEVWLIYNVVLVSGVHQSDLLIHIYMYIFFFRFFSLTGYLLQNIEYSFLCYRVGPCLSILYIVCIC